MPFTLENVPIELKAKGRKIPQWQLNEEGFVNEIQQSPARTTEALETVILICMGAARFRIFAFPTVSISEKWHEWDISYE